VLRKICPPPAFLPPATIRWSLSPEGGGAARRFYHPGDWKRIYVLRLLVAPEGEVRRSAGELVANLGGAPEAQ
jgi:hypothetical protein